MKLRAAIEEWFREHSDEFDLMSWQHKDLAVKLIKYIAPYFEKGKEMPAIDPSTIALTAREIRHVLLISYMQEEGKKADMNPEDKLKRLRDLGLVVMENGYSLTQRGLEVAVHFRQNVTLT